MFSSWKLERTGSLFTSQCPYLMVYAQPSSRPWCTGPGRPPATHSHTRCKPRECLPETPDTEKENTLSEALTSFHVTPTTPRSMKSCCTRWGEEALVPLSHRKRERGQGCRQSSCSLLARPRASASRRTQLPFRDYKMHGVCENTCTEENHHLKT